MTNKDLRQVIAALVVLLTISVLFSCHTSNVAIKNMKAQKAIEAVDAYIEKTADTGEMDEFLESPEGREYIKYSK